ncbi:MAG: PAS domain-containing protein, partial [Deltaproteobacteria bacterium]|nr:PAS domain-containing protein [Deltaproteobacteria bacterium]
MKRDGSKGMSRDAELEYLRERVKELESVSLELRKSGEEVLRVKESLAKAQEVAHLGNWDWDIINNTLYWSDEIYRIFGLKPQEFGATYETFLEAVHPDDRDMVTTGVNKALEENVEYSLDHRVVLSDGTVRWVHEQAVVSLSEDNCPISMVGTVQDITVQYEAEEKVRFLSTLPEENPNPVFRVDLSGVLIFANPSSFSVLKGKEFKVGKKVDKKWLDLVNEAYKSGIVKTVESKLGDKYFLFYVTPVEGGGYVNIYGLDVTSRKLA